MPGSFVSPRIAELVGAVGGVMPDSDEDSVDVGAAEVCRVAGILEGFLRYPDLLTGGQMEADLRAYRQHALYTAPAGGFSVVALVRLPGQRTPIHDHVSWCVVGTYIGAEEETRYRLDSAYGQTTPVLAPLDIATIPAGTVTYLVPPGDIHHVRNATSGKVISIHVYGADISVLGTSIRRRYDLPVRP
ncbi:hypothetical protein ACFXPT_38440 [Streptomyces goshikiensis]|uniref:cysteine dioxygenase family protein n=1 Tax=Streptomyces goshikiensis TaxID=1942 RepID=UPI0036CD687F